MRPKRRLNYMAESYPFLIYKRINFLHTVEVFNEKLEHGYNYLIKRVTAKWDTRPAPAPPFPAVPGFLSPEIKIAFYTGGGSISHQQLPVDLALLTSPAGAGVYYDPGVASRPLFAKSRKLGKTLNTPALAYDNLMIEVSGALCVSAVNPDLNHPSYCDILIEGRYFPIND